MAAYLRNFRFVVNHLRCPFSRAFGTKFNRNLPVKDKYVRSLQQKHLFSATERGKSNNLSSPFQGTSCSRGYHVGKQLSIKASELSNDKPLEKADVGCPICSANISFTYKDVLFLAQFLSPEGNLLNKRVTGVCGKQQIKLEKSIKISRRLGLLPKCGPIIPIETTNS